MTVKECQDCGVEIPPRYRTCSDCKGLRAKAKLSERLENRRNTFPPVPCACCGEMTERFHERDKWCSVQCKERARVRDPDKKREDNARWRSWNFDNRRDYMLRYSYGITQEIYEKMLAEQGGGCAICGKTPEEERRNLAVDHDHLSGEIFGILCASCNKILVGRIRSPEMFARAANYLTKGSGMFVPVRPAKKRKRKPRG